MRKRILAMALSICMAVVVCGCGNKKEADETQTGKTDVTVTGEDTVPSGDMAEDDLVHGFTVRRRPGKTNQGIPVVSTDTQDIFFFSVRTERIAPLRQIERLKILRMQ